MATRIEELRAARAAAEAEAKQAALTIEEQEERAEVEAIEAAKTEAAKAKADRRKLDGDRRLAEARAKHGDKWQLEAVDLVAMFPIDNVPADRYFPTGGVVIVRDSSDMEGAFIKAYEHRNAADSKMLDTLLIDIFTKCVVDPSPESPEAARVPIFANRFRPAAVKAAGVCRSLAGGKSKEKPRGVE